MILKNRPILSTAVLLLAVFPIAAQAYLDPGTGSMLLQVILGGVAAVGVALKLFWYRIIRFFGLGKAADSKDEEG